MKKVKICGLFRPEDIEAINSASADYAGFVINFPKSHRNLKDFQVEKLTRKLDKKIKAVGVFVDQPDDLVSELVEDGIIDIPQLHGKEDNWYIKGLKDLLPFDTEVWQAFQIKDATDIKRANESIADFVILDAGQGAGNTFDWSLLKGMEREYGLAGGISLENIDEALKTEAVLLDISGGAETDKVKDPEKIKNLVNKIKGER